MEKEVEYIQIMIESLQKKKNVLEQIIDMNRQQKIMLQDPDLSPEEFEKNMAYKGKLIDQLNLLDSGFEKLYERVKEILATNKAQYTEEIRTMQSLIKDITAQTNTIQTQEIRNKESVILKFESIREQVKGVRNSQKVVKQYYQNMVNSKKASVQMFDDKK